ncbi:hypothetical protein ACFOZY_00345 [Chungangia koreensis]|uniref:Uncharacterized protein n=1 Tax=Chungangia koreensis TaxID=752657 RepID=A0ABV8X0I9_9LACT
MFIKKAGGVILLLALLLTGCTEQEKEVKAVEDPNIETIKKYLEVEYNGPDEEFLRIEEEMFKGVADSEQWEAEAEERVKEYHQYLSDTFSPYMEEEAIQKYTMISLLFYYHHKAQENGYTFKTDKIDIQQQEKIERNYDYTVVVSFEKDGEEKTATMKGFITMSESGKISGIRGLSDSGFYQEMMETSNEGRDRGFLARGILQEQFGRTDHKLNKLWAGSENPLEDQKLVEYLNKKYISYFSNEGLEEFIASFGFVYPAIAAENGYELSVGEIEVVQDEKNPTSYSTSVVVHYKKEGGEGKSTTVKGIVTIKDGPVEKLEIVDDGGLKEALQER